MPLSKLKLEAHAPQQHEARNLKLGTALSQPEHGLLYMQGVHVHKGCMCMGMASSASEASSGSQEREPFVGGPLS